jgi:hypothetical protein
MLLAIIAAFAIIPLANALGADQAKKVYGSAFLDAFYDPGQEVSDAVKLRYKCCVLENHCTTPEMWKIIFMFHFLHSPGNLKTYQLESNLYSWRFAYPHLSKRDTQGRVEGLRHFAGESGLFLSVPDNHKDKKVGARTRAPEMFPTLDQEIDGFKDLWKREQVAQANLTGKFLSIEIARQETATDPRAWSVHPELPGGKYRVWTITAAWDGNSSTVEFAMPDESARYFVPSRMAQIATEAFAIHPGFFKAVFWDLEIQREHQSSWEPIPKWKLVESDAATDGNTWGMKRSKFRDRPAIEVSNDGTRTYATKGAIIELK